MTQAIQSGDTISVHYTGKLESGEIFDSSEGREPLKFTVGSGMLIKGFDQAVVGMKPGDSKSVTIEPEEGYGERNDEMYVEIPKHAIPEDLPLSVGIQVQLRSPEGHPMAATVAEIGEENVKMDLNHALAGKTLEFEIAIVETGLEPDAHACGHRGCACDDESKDQGGCGCDSGHCH
ncbi:MAG: peptidylprolyl isomerase [Desulfobacteraceae bacterium]|nr:MAG: peptidylprolyl isomerase [Desulfobacteraceae bacterium]